MAELVKLNITEQLSWIWVHNIFCDFAKQYYMTVLLYYKAQPIIKHLNDVTQPMKTLHVCTCVWRNSRDEIYREFQEYDKDKNGFVSLQEAEEVLAKRFGFNAQQTKHYLTICDTNQDGQLSYGEFVDFFLKIKEK